METRAAFLRAVAEHIQDGGVVGELALGRIRKMGHVKLAEYVDKSSSDTTKAGRDLVAQFCRTIASVEDIAEATGTAQDREAAPASDVTIGPFVGDSDEVSK